MSIRPGFKHPKWINLPMDIQQMIYLAILLALLLHLPVSSQATNETAADMSPAYDIISYPVYLRVNMLNIM